MPQPQTQNVIDRLKKSISYRRGVTTLPSHGGDVTNLMDEALDVILTLSENEENLFEQIRDREAQIQSLKSEVKDLRINRPEPFVLREIERLRTENANYQANARHVCAQLEEAKGELLHVHEEWGKNGRAIVRLDKEVAALKVDSSLSRERACKLEAIKADLDTRWSEQFALGRKLEEELKIAQHEIARLTDRNIELSRRHNVTVKVNDDPAWKFIAISFVQKEFPWLGPHHAEQVADICRDSYRQQKEKEDASHRAKAEKPD